MTGCVANAFAADHDCATRDEAKPAAPHAQWYVIDEEDEYEKMAVVPGTDCCSDDACRLRDRG